MSLLLMRLLLAQYVVLTAVCLFERRFYLSVYWLGAALITVGVLGQQR